MGQIEFVSHLLRCIRRAQHHFYDILPAPPRDLLRNNLLIIFKTTKVMKVHERLRNCSRLKETKVTNAMCGSGPDPFIIKGVIRTTDKT